MAARPNICSPGNPKYAPEFRIAETVTRGGEKRIFSGDGRELIQLMCVAADGAHRVANGTLTSENRELAHQLNININKKKFARWDAQAKGDRKKLSQIARESLSDLIRRLRKKHPDVIPVEGMLFYVIVITEQPSEYGVGYAAPHIHGAIVCTGRCAQILNDAIRSSRGLFGYQSRATNPVQPTYTSKGRDYAVNVGLADYHARQEPYLLTLPVAMSERLRALFAKWRKFLRRGNYTRTWGAYAGHRVGNFGPTLVKQKLRAIFPYKPQIVDGEVGLRLDEFRVAPRQLVRLVFPNTIKSADVAQCSTSKFSNTCRVLAEYSRRAEAPINQYLRINTIKPLIPTTLSAPLADKEIQRLLDDALSGKAHLFRTYTNSV